jgi:cbb3-type cytochrome oxidase maturation protein
MNVLLVMIPLSIVLLIGAAIAFFWAVDDGQFDDMDTPGLLPLDDNPRERDNGRDHRAESRDNRQPQ